MSAPRRDTAAVSRAAHGITAVRRISRISNGIAVNAIDVNVSPEPAWADYSVPTHASLSVHLEHAGGRAELRLKRDQQSGRAGASLYGAGPVLAGHGTVA
jgi:hypothetical protein